MNQMGKISIYHSNKWSLYGLTYFVTFIVTLPFIWMIMLSFKTTAEILSDPLSLPLSINVDNFLRAFTSMNILLLYKNTIILALVSVPLALLITFMSSYALSRLVFKSEKIRNGIYLFLLLGLAIPTFILLFPVYRITIFFNLLGTYTSLILPYIASVISFNTLLMTGFLKDFPKEVEEAAIIDGCGLARLCKSIVFPIIKPVIATVFIFNALHIWNEFPFAVTLLNKSSMYTIPLGISMFKGMWSIDYGGVVAASVLIIIPQLVFYGFFQKFIIAGMTAGAIKG